MEEVLSSYADQGIDPTMADTQYEFVDTQARAGLSAMPLNIPIGGRGGGGRGMMLPSSSMAPADIGLYAGGASTSQINVMQQQMQSLTSSIQRLSQIIMEDSGRTNMSIRSLSDLQVQAQSQISRQQMSMTQAQMMNPAMFPYAPGLAYQTDPRAAAFRAPMNTRGSVALGKPQASFFSDLMMGSSWYRKNWYEPALAEDAFMSTLGSSQRMEERMLYAQNAVGSFGSSLGGSLVGGGLLAAGASKAIAPTLAKYGLSKIGGTFGANLAARGITTAVAPIIGGTIALGDTLLDAFGLPSISGTFAKGAEAVYGGTIGQYFTNLDMARDIQKSTRFVTGPMAGVSGQGLAMGRAGTVVSGLRKMQSRDYLLDTEDYFKIFTESANQGLLNNMGSEEQMLSQVRKISKNLRLFMRISGDPDFSNAIKAMGDLTRLGVSADKLQVAATNIYTYSKMAGITATQAQNLGKQGAFTFQNAGADMGVGYQAGVFSGAISRLMSQTGTMSTGLKAMFGGEEGASQSLTEIMGAFLAGPVSKMILPSLLKKSGGRLALDPEALKEILTKGMSMDTLRRKAHALFSGDPSAQRQYATNNMELFQQATESIGVEGVIKFIINQAAIANNESGGKLGYKGSIMQILGSDKAATLFAKAFNPTTVDSLNESLKKMGDINYFNSIAENRSENYTLNNIKRTIKTGYHKLIGQPMAFFARQKAEEMEIAREAEMGIVNLNRIPVSEEGIAALGRLNWTWKDSLVVQKNKNGLAPFGLSDIPQSDAGSKVLTDLKRMFSPDNIDKPLISALSETEKIAIDKKYTKDIDAGLVQSTYSAFQGTLLGGVSVDNLKDLKKQLGMTLNLKGLSPEYKEKVLDRALAKYISLAKKSDNEDARGWGKRADATVAEIAIAHTEKVTQLDEIVEERTNVSQSWFDLDPTMKDKYPQLLQLKRSNPEAFSALKRIISVEGAKPEKVKEWLDKFSTAKSPEALRVLQDELNSIKKMDAVLSVDSQEITPPLFTDVRKLMSKMMLPDEVFKESLTGLKGTDKLDLTNALLNNINKVVAAGVSLMQTKEVKEGVKEVGGTLNEIFDTANNASEVKIKNYRITAN